MRNMMKEIITGAFLAPLFLLLISTNRYSEAAAVIADSSGVPNEDTNIPANDDFDKSPSLVGPLDNSTLPNNNTKASIGNGTGVPHPISGHSPRSTEQQSSGDNNHKDESATTATSSVKPEPVEDAKHETALEKITESISNVFSSLKNSVSSIFSPGSGLGRHDGEMDCSERNTSHCNSTLGGGEHHHHQEGASLDDDDHHKLAAEELLIHPVSSNDTDNNTNAAPTDTSGTSTATLSPSQNQAVVEQL